MIDFKEISYKGDTWELFARDFLLELGFYVESTPDRGPDGGKDILVSEELEGHLGKYRFKWLVSCKHFAKSGKSVNGNDDEKNILDRLSSFQVDGFIGFYSTIASSGLNSRLADLKREGKIRDFKIFDHRLIESHLMSLGFSQILMRYLPESYKKIRPLHHLASEYIPINCDHCGKDLLEALYREECPGIIAYVNKRSDNNAKEIPDIYFACKKECDTLLDGRARKKYDSHTSWTELSDIVTPLGFLQYIMATMNRVRDGNDIYTDKAFKKEKHPIMAIAQKVFREGTKRESERVLRLMELLPF